MGTVCRNCSCMVCASDAIREEIELWRPCGLTYVLCCTLDYTWCWSSRCCSSSPNRFLSRTSRSRPPAAQWNGEEVCAENWGSSSMGESSGVKDSSITRSELCPEGYHLKLTRAAMETWWRCRWWSRLTDPGRLWCGGLLVTQRRLAKSRN
jgi:hypothetical protein